MVVPPAQLLGAASLPSPGASHDPAQAQQPHARGCRLVLAALKGANPETAVGVVISTTAKAMAKRGRCCLKANLLEKIGAGSLRRSLSNVDRHASMPRPSPKSILNLRD